MRTRLFLAALAVAVSCGTRSESAPSASAVQESGERHEVADSEHDRCEAVEREGGPCVLWGPSLIALIARPEVYDGKRVRVIGFLNFEFEGNGLYVSREDWRHSIYRNGLWIDPPAGFESDSAPAARQPNQRYVLVEGTFRAGRGGHFGMWSGALEKVTRLQEWGAEPGDPSPPVRHP